MTITSLVLCNGPSGGRLMRRENVYEPETRTMVIESRIHVN